MPALPGVNRSGTQLAIAVLKLGRYSSEVYIPMWRDYLSKAEINLAAAGRDFEHGGYDPCVSRAYFAAFHAGLAALLALTDFQRQGDFWKHGHVAAELTRRLIHRRKIFPGTLANALDDLRSWRHQADYTDLHLSQNRAGQNLGTARTFVEQIKTTLREREP